MIVGLPMQETAGADPPDPFAHALGVLVLRPIHEAPQAQGARRVVVLTLLGEKDSASSRGASRELLLMMLMPPVGGMPFPLAKICATLAAGAGIGLPEASVAPKLKPHRLVEHAEAAVGVGVGGGDGGCRERPMAGVDEVALRLPAGGA